MGAHEITPGVRLKVVKLASTERNYFRAQERCRALGIHHKMPSHLLLGLYVKIRQRRGLAFEGAVACHTCDAVVPVFEQASNTCFDCLAEAYNQLTVDLDGNLVMP